MTKRKYGHGSLHRRSSDGRWIGRLPDGRGGHRYVTGTDEDTVRRRLEEMRRQRDRTTSGTRPRGGERLRELADRYMTTVAPINLRPVTIEGHRQRLDHHVLPLIGSIRVAQMDVADVQRVVRAMQAKGLSPKTIENTVGVLSSVLQHAVRERTVDVNVARLATLPPVAHERLPALTTDELHRFLEATRGDRVWPVYVLLATTGMRVSEVLGLFWRDVTPTSVAVTGQYRRVRRGDDLGWVRAEPKTARSRRVVYLPALAREAMAVAKSQARSAKLVFASTDGEPMDRRWVGRSFDRALTKHGFPDVRLHSLRSSAIIAVLNANGGDLRDAMHMAGHSSITTTLDRYGQEADEARKRAADAMDAAMAKIAKK